VLRTQPIAVGVFDGSEIFRRGVAACLADDEWLDVRVVGPVPVETDELDVAVVSGEVASRHGLACPLVVCTGHDGAPAGDDGNVFAVLPRHQLRPEQLVGAVRAAAVGLRIRTPEPVGSRLNRRSVRVLEMLAEGAGTRDISSSLGYSERTVKGVIADAIRELGARNRSHAVAEAVRRSLV
jgi:DNA-binding CsgD family transcriptional regulator